MQKPIDGVGGIFLAGMLQDLHNALDPYELPCRDGVNRSQPIGLSVKKIYQVLTLTTAFFGILKPL